VNPQMAKAHREAFEAAMLERSDDPVAILGSGHERLRNGDVPYPFRPHSHFWYLTGFAEPDAYLVLRPASQTPLTFFVRPRDREMEIWNGRRAGVEGMIERFGADAAHPVEALFERLPDLLRGADTLYARTGEDHDFDARLLALANRLRDKTRDGTTGPPGVVDPGTLLNELRLFKSDDELAILRAPRRSPRRRTVRRWPRSNRASTSTRSRPSSTGRSAAAAAGAPATARSPRPARTRASCTTARTTRASARTT